MSVSNHLVVDQNDSRRWTVTFFDPAFAPVNPSAVTYYRRLPTESTAGLITTTGWSNTSTGVYSRDILFDTAGLWELEARGAGGGVDQVERLTVEVRPSRVS